MRIYYGPNGREPFWNVKVRDAKTSVKINGKIAHALLASAGVTINCSLSRTCMDPANKRSIGHPVYLAVVTKDRALLVDSLHKGGSLKGTPKTAVRYCHEYADLIDMNDTGELKKRVRLDPTILERDFVLRRPARSEKLGASHKKTGNPGYSGKKKSAKAIVQRGALARARKAGLVSEGVAIQLAEQAA